jgi:hypothetical protein
VMQNVKATAFEIIKMDKVLSLESINYNKIT